MGKPRLIILIRHAQSEGNKNRDIHQTVPDHRVKLTAEGRKQAVEAGKKLRSLLRPDDTLHFYTSPYRRTRETTEGILSSLTSDSPSPSPFPRHTIKVYEEPRLREQDFGNFQPCSAEMTRMWQERADYGHFFYRIPDGESAADAYDRVSGFNESLWRSFGEDDFASVCVLVTHGLMTRVFLMKWYHWSVEYFEDLRNVNHCEFVVMQKERENGKYILKNQLRTWTQYKIDREAAHSAAGKEDPQSPVPIRKKWGGCPDGCAHSAGDVSHRAPRRQNTADLFKDDGTSSLAQLEAAMQRKASITLPAAEEGDASSRGRDKPALEPTGNGAAGIGQSLAAPAAPEKMRVLSPNRLAVLRAGRDGGGSWSGNVSQSGSSDEETDATVEEDDKKSAERAKQFRPPRSMARALEGTLREESPGMSTGARADALGDQSDVDDEEEDQDVEAKKQKEREGAFEESVR